MAEVDTEVEAINEVAAEEGHIEEEGEEERKPVLMEKQ